MNPRTEWHNIMVRAERLKLRPLGGHRYHSGQVAFRFDSWSTKKYRYQDPTTTYDGVGDTYELAAHAAIRACCLLVGLRRAQHP